MSCSFKYAAIVTFFHTHTYSNFSFKDAADFAKAGGFDAYIAVGGGSVIDTCKAANLYASDPQADFLDYVNPPIGKGKPVTVKLSPLIASKYDMNELQAGTAVVEL